MSDDDIEALQQNMDDTARAATAVARRLTGLSRQDAATLVEDDARFDLQFVAPGQAVTLDFRPNRIRATVADDVVVSASAG